MKETATRTLTITSDAFENNKYIPSMYTCEGENINPPIKIQNIPDSTVSLAFIIDDPDAPVGIFTHYVAWNIVPKLLLNQDIFSTGNVGMNDFNKTKYMGPCPPSGTHRYFFKIYALDITLSLDKIARKESLEEAMRGHVIAYGELIGLYKKIK